MAVSPADFELYSRVTGRPVPRSPQERVRLAPEVNRFIRNREYERPEQTTLQKGADLLGKAALIGGTLAAAHAIGGGFKGKTAENVGKVAEAAGLANLGGDFGVSGGGTPSYPNYPSGGGLSGNVDFDGAALLTPLEKAEAFLKSPPVRPAVTGKQSPVNAFNVPEEAWGSLNEAEKQMQHRQVYGLAPEDKISKADRVALHRQYDTIRRDQSSADYPGADATQEAVDKFNQSRYQQATEASLGGRYVGQGTPPPLSDRPSSPPPAVISETPPVVPPSSGGPSKEPNYSDVDPWDSPVESSNQNVVAQQPSQPSQKSLIAQADELVDEIQTKPTTVVPSDDPAVAKVSGTLVRKPGSRIQTRNQSRPGLLEGIHTGIRFEDPRTTGVLATAVRADGTPLQAIGGGGAKLTFPARYQTPMQRAAYGGPFSLSTKAAMAPRFWELGGSAPPGWATGLGGTLGHMAEGAIGLVQPELIPVLGAGEAIGNFVSHIPQIAGAGASVGVRALEQAGLAGATAIERAGIDSLNFAMGAAAPLTRSAGTVTRRVGDRLFDVGQGLRSAHDTRLVPAAQGAARRLGQWDVEGRYYYDRVLAPKADAALDGIQRNMNALRTSADQQFNIDGKVGAVSDYILPATRETGDVVPGRRLNDHPDIGPLEQDTAPSRAIQVVKDAFKIAGEGDPGSLTPDDVFIRTDIVSKDPVNVRTWAGERRPSARTKAEFAAGLRDRNAEWYDRTDLPEKRVGGGGRWMGRRGSEGQAASLSPVDYGEPTPSLREAVRNLSGESFIKGLTQPLSDQDRKEIEAARGIGKKLAETEIEDDKWRS